MGSLENRFVLRGKDLNLKKVVRDAVEACKDTDREIVVVGSYLKYLQYRIIKFRVKRINSGINVSYENTSYKMNLPYNDGSYTIEMDCFKFK